MAARAPLQAFSREGTMSCGHLCSPAGMSDLDRSAHCPAPWYQVGCFSMIFRCNRNPSEVQVPFGEVFINLNLGIPGGNVLLEVRGARRQLCRQDECFYQLNYPKDVHVSALDDPRVVRCGLNGQFHCSVTDSLTYIQQSFDSVYGEGLIKLLLTRIPVCCDKGSSISPESLSFAGQYRCSTLFCLSILVQEDTDACNIASTLDAGCWLHVSHLNFRCLAVLLSLQHARRRIVVTQIPIGPL